MALKHSDAARYTTEPGYIIISIYVVHRDSRSFLDPGRFDPDRWTREQRAARPRFSYFPFGGGARVCTGAHFAWLEGVLPAVLGQRRKLRSKPGHPVDYRALLKLQPKH